MRTFFDSTQSPESKSDAFANEFYASMCFKTHFLRYSAHRVMVDDLVITEAKLVCSDIQNILLPKIFKTKIIDNILKNTSNI